MRVEVEYSPELVVTEMFVNSRQGEEEVSWCCTVSSYHQLMLLSVIITSYCYLVSSSQANVKGCHHHKLMLHDVIITS